MDSIKYLPYLKATKQLNQSVNEWLIKPIKPSSKREKDKTIELINFFIHHIPINKEKYGPRFSLLIN